MEGVLVVELTFQRFRSVVFLHDPVSFAALVRPEYFTFKKGVVRVETKGICTGHTSMDL
jgi:uridine nucleosidase